MATKQPVYCKKTSSKVIRKNHNGPINVSRCSKTDVSSENSVDCVYENNHCGLVTRKKNRVMSRSRNTARKHHVSKVHMNSNCTDNYLKTNRCDEPCKSVSSYRTKNGKMRRASCRQQKKMLKGGEQPAEVAAPTEAPDAPVAQVQLSVPSPININNVLSELNNELSVNVPEGLAATIDSEYVINAIKLIQSKTQSKVDPRNELKALDMNNDGRVGKDDLLLLASFKAADTDSSGSLSMAEAEIGLSAKLGKPAYLTNKEFKTADISSNDSLDFSEYQVLYVFKSNSIEENGSTYIPTGAVKGALAELGISSVSNEDIFNSDMNKNGKMDFAEFLLLVAFKWADMNSDSTIKSDSKLDYKETAMAFRLLGMQITQDEFRQADTDNSGALDFSEFTSFVAFKKVMKDSKIMDKTLLTQALDFLNLSSLANEVRDSKAEQRAEKAKDKAKQDEEDQKSKEEKERLELKKKEKAAELSGELSKTLEDDKNARIAKALQDHLKTLKVCDGTLLRNDDNVQIPSLEQKCLSPEQVKSWKEELKECNGKDLVNPGTENDLPFTQVCVQKGGQSNINLKQFINIVKSIRNNKLHHRVKNVRRKMYF